MRGTDRQNAVAVRQQLNANSYDISSLLETKIRSVDGKDQEKKLLAIFGELTNNLSVMTQDIDNELVVKQSFAKDADSHLLHELQNHEKELKHVGKAVDVVMENFHRASEGAVRIGEQLAGAERERKRIDNALDIMECIRLFESADPAMYSDMHTLDVDQIRDALPTQWSNKSWGEISKILHDLKRILFDINSDDVQTAQKNVIKVAEAVEAELLAEFEVAVLTLMEEPDDEELIRSAHEFATWLHLYNDGEALQKRYIFSVVERRIPRLNGKKNAPKRRDSGHKHGHQLPSFSGAVGLTKAALNLNSLASLASKGFHHDDEHSDAHSDVGSDSSAGASFAHSDDEEMHAHSSKPPHTPHSHHTTHHHTPHTHGRDSHHGSPTGPSNLVADNLSELFGTIGNVCEEQFDIIRKVFPTHSITRVTRLLIQRIFNDPAFGLQARVDAVLHPKPPLQPLPTSEFLDALMTIRQKLSALFVILMEHCVSNERLQAPLALGPAAEGAQDKDGAEQTATASALLAHNDKKPKDRQRIIGEVKEFLEEQMFQLLSSYMADYFDMEINYAKTMFADGLRKAVAGDMSLLTSTGNVAANAPTSRFSVGRKSAVVDEQALVNNGNAVIPRFRAEKTRNIAHIVKTVANTKYIDTILQATSDCVHRMECIGKDDKKLPLYSKDLYLLELSYIVDGLFIPWSKACTNFLLKHAAVRAQSSELPPMEFLTALATVYTGVSKLKSHFNHVYLRPISLLSNAVVLCKESRMRAIVALESVARESISAWTLCVVVHVDKLLSTLQSKYNYNPKTNDLMSLASAAVIGERTVSAASSTTACETVCKELFAVAQSVHHHQHEFLGLNLSETFWKPLGQQIVGNLISHFRRQKISEEGGIVLLKDINSYCEAIASFDCVFTLDMIYCLRDIAHVFTAPAERVTKMVMEDFRHLDTEIVLSLIKARTDALPPSQNPIHWTKELANHYSSFRRDDLLSWETKKHLTVVSFSESTAAGSNSSILGPKTLRKTQMPASALHHEVAQHKIETYSEVDHSFTSQEVNNNEYVHVSLAPAVPDSSLPVEKASEGGMFRSSESAAGSFRASESISTTSTTYVSPTLPMPPVDVDRAGAPERSTLYETFTRQSSGGTTSFSTMLNTMSTAAGMTPPRSQPPSAPPSAPPSVYSHSPTPSVAASETGTSKPSISSAGAGLWNSLKSNYFKK